MTAHFQTRNRPSPAVAMAASFVSGGQFVPAFSAKVPILGIDASVGKIGFCLVYGSRLRAWVYRPRGRGIARLLEVREEMARILAQYAVGLAVIEGYSFGSKNSNAHSTGEVGAIVRTVIAMAGVTLWEAPPSSLKKFLSGKGNTAKVGMPLALYKQYGVDYADEDEADASGLAAIGAALVGDHPQKLHKYQEDAVSGVAQVFPHVKKLQPVANSVD